MKGEVRNVKIFFNQTGLYLHKRYGIMLRRQLIKELASSQTFKNVLDVGCGDGTLVLDFVDTAEHIAMIDLSENMLTLAKSNIESSFPGKHVSVDYYNTDFASFESNSQFDLILLVGVLAHVPDLDVVFTKVKNLVKNDGLVIVQYSDANHLMIKMRHWWHRKNSSYSLNVISEKLILDLCERNDLLMSAQKRFNFSFFGMKYLNDMALYRFQYWLIKQRWLSFLLSDVIVVLKKNGRG